MRDAFNRALLSPGESDNLRAARRIESFWRTQLSRAKKGTEAYSEILSALVAAHQTVEGYEAQLAAEEDRHDAAIQQQREDRARKRAQRAEKLERIEREERRQNRERYERMLRNRRVDEEIQDKIAMRTGRSGTSKTGTTGSGGLTEADFRSLSFEFLTSLNGVIGQFGGNTVDPGWGQMATQSYAQTQLIREQNRLIEGLSSSVKSPGSRYAKVELTAAGWGVGY
jgi:hypothetical protein